MLVIAVVAVLAAGPALGATDPYLVKTLKASMIKSFKKQAPNLKITKVTCVLPKDGVTAHCKGYFTAGGTTGYYPVAATIHDSGNLTWTAQSPKCLDPQTKKYTGCG